MNIKKLKVENIELFNGDEHNFYGFKFSVPTQGESIELKTTDFLSQNFKQLKENIGDEQFQNLIIEGGFKKTKGFIKFYEGKNNLKLYYCLKFSKSQTKYLTIISFGEGPPTRFRMYLEGIWEIID